jgi:hypothetical protein
MVDMGEVVYSIVMLKATNALLSHAERRHPGFDATLTHYEHLVIPSCPACGSHDTAMVVTGVC